MLSTHLVAVLSLILVGMVLWLINGFIPIPAGRIKTVVNVVLALIVVGVGLWLINTYIPMAGVIKGILNIVVVIATCVGVLQAFGQWESVANMSRKIRNHRWSHAEECEKAATHSDAPATILVK
jgi:asparagine N-glycosylation enzyme membrane subunit Stt3